jgi:uncharacterized membrane protein YebE (DUF533 family)
MNPENVLRSVATILRADGRIGVRERAFLDRLRGRLGLGAEAVAAAVAEVEAGKQWVYLPHDSRDRQFVLDRLVEAAAADGAVAEGERRMLDIVAEKVGIAACELEDRIERELEKVAPRVPGMALPPERAREVLKAAASVIGSDHELTAGEREFLARLAGRLGLASPDVPPGRPNLDVLRAGTEAERRAIYAILREAADADGTMSVQERGRLAAFGAFLGIRE